ncbi:HNH endonuclease signature motif containing protein [Marinobacter sp. OP 3.4]|uniref:HNH endonuclease signature motif containing protein n=1 Tax=Marinobacter sp. OP 3.4 TaxID=3076501 RepID=UPI002E22F82B
MNDELFKEWVQESFEKHGLVGMVAVKGMDSDYRQLLGLIEWVGIEHGFDALHDRGLGAQVNDVFRMACEGMTAKEIAAEMGYDKHKSVARFCSRHGIELPKRLELSDLEDDIRGMAETMSAPEIARELGFSSTQVYRICRKLAIKPVNKAEGVIYTHNGYRMLLALGHPDADSKGYIREHRLVAEQKLGRRIREDEIVHHLNGDKLDNRPDNLEIMTRSEHNRHHAVEGETGWAVYHRKNASKI